MSCFGVITGVFGSTDLKVTHKGYHRVRGKTGMKESEARGDKKRGKLPGSDASFRQTNEQ